MVSPRRSSLASPSRRAWLGAAAALLGVAGCGYRPVRAVVSGRPKIAVDRVDALVAGGDGVRLADEAVLGARQELARLGALAGAGDEARGCDRLAVAIARVDERSEGIGVDAADDRRARARGVRVRIVARGIVRGPDGAFETADREQSEVVAVEAGAVGWSAARDEALRRLARQIGADVARATLGLP